MAKMGKFTVVETESYLIAYEDMLNRFKKPSQPIPLANLSQSSIPSDQNFQRNYNPSRGRGRGGRFMRGGRFTNSSLTSNFSHLMQHFQLNHITIQPLHHPFINLGHFWQHHRHHRHHHVTAEPNNLLQAAENQIGSDQLYIGNGQASLLNIKTTEDIVGIVEPSEWLAFDCCCCNVNSLCACFYISNENM
nr:uncharacterized protein LOC112751725 isoform X1 [Arachis hypogaea]